MRFKTWQRLTSDGAPIYVQPDGPDWFVPDRETDLLLQALQGGERTDLDRDASRLLQVEQLAALLLDDQTTPYPGRGSLLRLSGLKECWFHLTDRCNLACRHCLFAASPAQAATLSAELLACGLKEAQQLGCTLFCFTGGEPFLYPGLIDLLAELLAEPSHHAVILSNGLLIAEQLEGLQRLPRERLHLQLSLDGLQEQHEALRGKGSYEQLLANIRLLRQQGFPLTLSVAVNRSNLTSLAEIVDCAAELGVTSLHLLWHFVRGKGSAEQFVSPAQIFSELIRAQKRAEERGLLIDNVESLRHQIFTSPGTRHDLANTAWESLAIGPDGAIYPSPALVGLPELRCGHLHEGLEQVWRQSLVLGAIRRASLTQNPATEAKPLKFLTGGGDLDHSYLAGGGFVGHDPYTELYDQLALWLIARQARHYPLRSGTGILLRMGDLRCGCPGSDQEVHLTHCNCVIALADDQGHRSVRDFYGKAAVTANLDIINPFGPSTILTNFIPEESKQKSYGCGSPVRDANLKPGEVLVDLGSGSGVECFLAAAAVGRSGKVFGVDMTDEMLALAERGKEKVVAELGYDNLEFTKGFLEAIPLADDSADVVISNCVINLSPDKRQTLHEVWRILKPGGRLVVSDIVSDTRIPLTIKNNEKFRGECLGGALRQSELLAMLRAAGFTGVRLIKRFPYRTEGETRFYSLTFRADKPAAEQLRTVIYRGPFAAIWTEDGSILLKGQASTVRLSEAESLADSLFILDEHGAVSNLLMENSCCPSTAAASAAPSPLPMAAACCPPSSKIIPLPGSSQDALPRTRHHSGCMVCGEELRYLIHQEEACCHYCGGSKKTSTVCTSGHYICDDCHQQDGLSLIRLACLESREPDMLTLLAQIRRHPAIPLHGPEHHAMVPGIILACYRNRGGAIDRQTILTGIERGSKVPGGVCGFWGNCGAAAGVGIAFSVLLAASPLSPEARQQVQRITAQVLAEIAQTKGARCCQRETVTALKAAARISRELLPIRLLTEADFVCRQSEKNRECIGRACSLWAGSGGQAQTAGP